MREIIKPGLILFIITVTAAIALGAVYEITKEPIRLQKEKDKIAAMNSLLPTASFFKQEELIENSNGVYEVYIGEEPAKTAGYIIYSESRGYGGIIGVLTAISETGGILDISIINSNETAGLGDNAKKPAFTDQYRNKTSALSVVKNNPGDSEIQAITSATITSKAVTSAVNAALDYYGTHLAGR